MKLTKENIAIIAGDEYLSRDIELAGRLDVAHDYLQQFKPYIPEGGVVIDVGACLGDYTVTFAEMVGASGHVLAFEPNLPVFDCLLHNIKKFSHVNACPVGLGSVSELIQISEDSRNIGASYLSKQKATRNALVYPMDDILPKFTRLDFIKIDAEGYEPWVLDGGVNTINRFRPAMLIEIDQRALGLQGFKPADVHTRLDALNYQFDRFDGAHGNILCLPK